jgi:hypothetical protein
MATATTHRKSELLADEERCWNALLARDTTIDGLVVFGVRVLAVPGIVQRPHMAIIAAR